MSDVKSYFEKRSSHHAYHLDPSLYTRTTEDIKQLLGSGPLDVLDLGCGDGSFISGLKKSGIKGKFIGIDLSQKLVAKAIQDLGNATADFLLADGFNLPFRPAVKFDLIHLGFVLHHLIGRTRYESRHLAQKLVGFLHERLSENGVVIVDELYFVSFWFPELTASVIFYGLKLMNALHIDLSKVNNEFQPGLEVSFFSDKSLDRIFELYSKRIPLIRPSKFPKLYKLFLVKKYGRICYVAHR